MNLKAKLRLRELLRRRSGAAETLLYIGANRLIRADFAGGSAAPVLEQIFEAGSPPSSEGLAVLADAAFSLGPAGRRNVYILSNAVMSQVLAVTRTKLAGLEGAELTRALGFEAETMSGINPFDAVTEVRPVGQEGAEMYYWVSQMSSNDLSELRSGLARQQADLRGIVHPGGLPRPLSQAEVGSDRRAWQRLELWPDQVICLAGGDGPAKTHFIGVPPTRVTWKHEAEQWFASSGGTGDRECLAPDATLLAFGDGNRMSLSDDATLKAWLSAWASELVSGAPRVPVVVPPRPPMPDRRRYAISGAVAVGVAGICALHSVSMKRREARLRSDLAAMQLPINHLTSLKGRLDQMKGESGKREAELRDLRDLQTHWVDTLSKEHRRHAAFLAALTSSVTEDMVITSTSEQSGVVRVETLNLRPDASSFVTNLAAQMNPLGWLLEPPFRKAMALQEDGGPWVLTYQLRPPGNQVVQPVATTGDLPILIPATLNGAGGTNQLARVSQ